MSLDDSAEEVLGLATCMGIALQADWQENISTDEQTRPARSRERPAGARHCPGVRFASGLYCKRSRKGLLHLPTCLT